jgi:hypothetical protein
MVAIVSVLIFLGAMSRLRFDVLIVLSAVILSWLFDSDPTHFSVSSTLISATLFAAALQLGYFGGAAMRSLRRRGPG